jgi:hypothetical protein
MRLDLLVTLKTADLVRETAWLALTGQLGWEGRLADLTRHRLWRFAVTGPAATEREGARGLLAAEIERSADYYNPNKERLVWPAAEALDEGEPLVVAGAAASAPRALPAPGTPVWLLGLWVTDEGGEAPTLARRTAAGLAPSGLELASLHTGSYWELALAAATADEARRLAADLAISRGRHEGLLLNPHYQEGRLLRVAARPAAAARS